PASMRALHDALPISARSRAYASGGVPPRIHQVIARWVSFIKPDHARGLADHVQVVDLLEGGHHPRVARGVREDDDGDILHVVLRSEEHTSELQSREK